MTRQSPAVVGAYGCGYGRGSPRKHAGFLKSLRQKAPRDDTHDVCILVPNVLVGIANLETLFQLNNSTTDSKANRVIRFVLKWKQSFCNINPKGTMGTRKSVGAESRCLNCK